MARKLKVRTHDWDVGKGFGSTSENDEEISGDIYTSNGLVKVWSGRDGKVTFIEFVYRGRYYVKRINRFYSSRYLVTLAKRFSNEIIVRHGHNKVSYRTQVLIHIFEFKKRHKRGIGFNELVESTGLSRAIVSKSHDSLSDMGIIYDDWVTVDGKHMKALFITPASLKFVGGMIQDLLVKIQ